VVFFAGEVRDVVLAVVFGVVFAVARVVLAGVFFAVAAVVLVAFVALVAVLLLAALVVLAFVDDALLVVLLAALVVFGAALAVVDLAVDLVVDLVAVFGVVFDAALVVLAFVVVFGAVAFVVVLVLLVGAVAFVVRADVVRAVVVPRVRLVVVRVVVGRVVAVFDVPVARFTVVALGSFLAPLTTSLNVVPARKAGTLVFFTRTVSPVRGFLAVRAARVRFSNTPKPVMLTFSPLLTVRMMMSTRLSTACAATFLSPKRSASASMSWALLAIQSSKKNYVLPGHTGRHAHTVLPTQHKFQTARGFFPYRVRDYASASPCEPLARRSA
jgi:hypothetical protein